MDLVQTLIDQKYAEPVLPRGLRELYDGDLHFPTPSAERPYVIGNFVSTLDGVVSFKMKGHAGGSTISASDAADRFIMGLLRASADAVMIGAGTLHDVSPEGLWIPEYAYPSGKHLYTEYRVNVLHKPEYPLVVIVSGSGKLELNRAIFRTPKVRTAVITTSTGRDELTKAGVTKLNSVELHALDAFDGGIDPQAIMKLLHVKLGVRILLHEGGPTLFGKFLEEQAIDELFLTVSPQIGGRAVHTIRPGLVQGVEFPPEGAPWFQLLSVKERDDYLYLRYGRTGPRLHVHLNAVRS
jgi:riboflavin biosynthesis pyrimidine reductase